MGQSFYLYIGALLVLQVVVIIIGVRLRKKRLSRLGKQFPTPPVHKLWRSVIIGAAMLVVLTAMPLVLSPGSSVLIAMLGAVPMSLMFVAMGLFAQVKQRRGNAPRCAACEYDLSGTRDSAPSAQSQDDTKCPECGASCSKPSAVVYGERVWSRRALVIACLLLVPLLVKFATPMIFGFISTGAFFVSLMPTGSLLKQVAYSKSFRMAEWAELDPKERERARLNFAETKKRALVNRGADWETYQALSPEEKQRLAAQASPKPTGAAVAVKPVDPSKLTPVPVTRRTTEQGDPAKVSKPQLDRNTLLPRPASPTSGVSAPAN